MSTPRIPGRRFLHSPGPTPLPDAVLHAMSVQPMDHRRPAPAMPASKHAARLGALLHTDASELLLYASSGHGVWEAVIENLAAPGQAFLIPGTGHFSSRGRCKPKPWGAVSCARRGARVGPSMRLRSNRHCATTARTRWWLCWPCTPTPPAGVTSDLAAMRRAIDAARHPALLVADVVASLGAAPFAMDTLGVDIAVGASQKGPDVPAGRGASSRSTTRRWRWPERCTAPRFLWDWVRRRRRLVVPQILRHTSAELCCSASRRLCR